MIKVDQPALDASIARWNQHIAGKIDMLHGAGQGMIRVEAGRLAQTLIKITPPVDRQSSMQKVEDRVTAKFKALGDPSGKYHCFDDLNGPKNGTGDVRWYAFSPTGIYGVSQGCDLSNANVDGLYQVYFQTRMKNGRIVAGHRGKQTVYLWQRYLTKAATVKKLAARLKRHFGRLKAGWLVAWNELGQPRGEFAPPQWVTRHETGARGYAINGLGDPRFPQFTLENHAKGCGSDLMRRLTHDALEIRSEAMVKRMVFLLKYPEKAAEETQ